MNWLTRYCYGSVETKETTKYPRFKPSTNGERSFNIERINELIKKNWFDIDSYRDPEMNPVLHLKIEHYRQYVIKHCELMITPTQFRDNWFWDRKNLKQTLDELSCYNLEILYTILNKHDETVNGKDL